MAVKPHPSIPGAYLIDYWPQGRKGKRKYETYVGSRENAERRHMELVRQHASTAAEKTNPRINDALPEYLLWIENNKSKAYLRSWNWALEKLKPAFGNFPPSQITEILIEDFKARYKSAPVHCNQCLTYLGILINWMVRKKYCNSLPFRIEKLPYVKPLPQPPSPTAVEELFDNIRGRFKPGWKREKAYRLKLAGCYIMYDNGPRWVEIRHILWENINWNKKAVYLGRTKTGKPRYALIPDEALEILKDYDEKEGYVFLNPKTEQPYISIKTLLKNNAKGIGEKFKGTHAFRHATGTDSLEANGDLRGTQEVLGHTDLRSTQVYTDVSLTRKREIVEKTRAYREKSRKACKDRALSTVDKKAAVKSNDTE